MAELVERFEAGRDPRRDGRRARAPARRPAGLVRRRAGDPVRHRAQPLDQLRRLVDLVLRADHRDPHRQPVEVVVARAHLAAVRRRAASTSPSQRRPSSSARGRVHASRAPRSAPCRTAGSARTYAAASLAGSLRGLKRTPVDAGCAMRSTRNVRQSVAPAVPGHEVPAAAGVDERVRLGLAAACRPVARACRRSARARGRGRRRRAAVRHCGSTCRPAVDAAASPSRSAAPARGGAGARGGPARA